MPHHRIAESLLDRQEFVLPPAHDGNGTVGAVGLAGEVLVRLQATVESQGVVYGGVS
jgi:hypothetical protein